MEKETVCTKARKENRIEDEWIQFIEQRAYRFAFFSVGVAGICLMLYSLLFTKGEDKGYLIFFGFLAIGLCIFFFSRFCFLRKRKDIVWILLTLAASILFLWFLYQGVFHEGFVPWTHG